MIDPRTALGTPLPARPYRWTESEVLRYHLALGAGPDNLRWSYERNLVVLPTFPALAPSAGMFDPPALLFPGVHVDLTRVLHASQEVELGGPIPRSGTVTLHPRVVEVWDKGTAAVLVHETIATNTAGEQVFRSRSTLYCKGEGGFGGERGPSTRPEPLPPRAADAELTVSTLPQQALLYRLCGDRNPLHADPEFAAAAGFDRPILHGLASYGMVTMAIMDARGLDDVRSVTGSFTGVVYPGETLRVRLWVEDQRITYAATVPDRGNAAVLTGSLAGRA
ncbi:MaoC/PaaZ C-terminal domain-containing protein [Labedaea rhizosphaerae]|uniref:MaoC/PaaZ C-terminal domain-containing protein n=1 Tax=Labedaea rhizosphaerae TaxID=598644 RepID=UPI001FB5C667|nr:MaoC/PaaZ C-terminal domain-containing protein [Labedaea rhizosphaerae]